VFVRENRQFSPVGSRFALHVRSVWQGVNEEFHFCPQILPSFFKPSGGSNRYNWRDLPLSRANWVRTATAVAARIRTTEEPTGTSEEGPTTLDVEKTNSVETERSRIPAAEIGKGMVSG